MGTVKDRFKPTPKLAITGGVVLLVVIAAVALTATQNNLHTADNAQQITAQQPEYATILPNGRTATELGGWQRVSPTDSEPVYAYTDSIEGVEISVSQQPLPENFKSNPDARVKELAKSYSAETEVKAGATTAYVGTSSQGPQSIIFVKAGLLVLIKSQNELSQDALSQYIQSLN